MAKNSWINKSMFIGAGYIDRTGFLSKVVDGFEILVHSDGDVVVDTYSDEGVSFIHYTNIKSIKQFNKILMILGAVDCLI